MTDAKAAMTVESALFTCKSTAGAWLKMSFPKIR